MKKFFLILLGSLLALSAWSQINLSSLKVSQLDISKAKVLLQNLDPVYVRSVIYAGKEYSVGVKAQNPSLATVLATLDPKKLDATKAKVSIAGPDKVYISSVYYNGKKYGILLVGDKTKQTAALEYYTEKDQLVSYWDLIDTSGAKVAPTSKDSFSISNIVVGGATYSVNLKFGDSQIGAVVGTEKTGTAVNYAAVVKEYETQIGSLKNALDTTKASLSSTKIELNNANTELQKKATQIAERDATIAKLNAEIQKLMLSVSSGTSESGLDSFVAKLSAGKADISKATVVQEGTTVTIKNLIYNTKPYNVVLVYDDARKIAGITQVLDSNNKSILSAGLSVGWGEFKTASAGYLKLKVILDALRKDAADAKAREAQALTKLQAAEAKALAEAKAAADAKAREAKALADLQAAKALADLKAGPDSALDSFVAKLSAGKADISKATVTQEGTKVTIKNLIYNAKPYSVVFVYDDAKKAAGVSQVLDSSGKSLLPAALNVGWGQFKVASAGYAKLKAILDSLRNDLKTANEAKKLAEEFANKLKEELAKAQAPVGDAGCEAVKAELAGLKAEDEWLLKMALMINPNKVDISKAYVDVKPETVSVVNIGYNGKPYTLLVEYDDEGKTAEITSITDSSNKNILPEPINFGWVQYKTIATGYQGLKAIIDSLREQANKVKDLEAKIAELEKAPKAQVSKPLVEEFPKVVLSGLKGGKDLMGTWKLDGNTITQQNTKLFFAKHGISVKQDQAELLFGITAKGSDTPKLGYGLHFLASGSKNGEAYGFGDSYLVWVTKDSLYSNYEPEATYVQLYRSHTDFNMKEIASINIPESITSSLKVEVKYTGAKVIVYVNGVQRIEYSVPKPVKMVGDTVALRTMGGPIQFTDLYVRTK